MGALRLEDLPNYTYEDYERWEGRWELLYGVAYSMSPSPIREHQDISTNISIALHSSLKKCTTCKAHAALDWHVDDSTIVCPDNVVMCNDTKNSNFITITPSIIFEVLSPSTKKKDRTIKYELYEKSGVSYYILVEPVGMFAEIYELKNNRYILVSEIKDGKYEFILKDCKFKLDFTEIFNIF